MVDAAKSQRDILFFIRKMGKSLTKNIVFKYFRYFFNYVEKTLTSLINFIFKYGKDNKDNKNITNLAASYGDSLGNLQDGFDDAYKFEKNNKLINPKGKEEKVLGKVGDSEIYVSIYFNELNKIWNRKKVWNTREKCWKVCSDKDISNSKKVLNAYGNRRIGEEIINIFANNGTALIGAKNEIGNKYVLYFATFFTGLMLSIKYGNLEGRTKELLEGFPNIEDSIEAFEGIGFLKGGKPVNEDTIALTRQTAQKIAFATAKFLKDKLDNENT